MSLLHRRIERLEKSLELQQSVESCRCFDTRILHLPLTVPEKPQRCTKCQCWMLTITVNHATGSFIAFANSPHEAYRVVSSIGGIHATPQGFQSIQNEEEKDCD